MPPPGVRLRAMNPPRAVAILGDQAGMTCVAAMRRVLREARSHGTAGVVAAPVIRGPLAEGAEIRG
jgi:hypothetical protein